MRNTLTFILTFIVFFAFGQKFVKSEIEDLSQVKLNKGSKSQIQFAKMVSDIENLATPPKQAGAIINKDLSIEENIVFINNVFTLTTTFNHIKNTLVINKKLDGKSIKSIDIEFEGYIQLVNENGDFLYILSSCGEADEVQFYNNNLELIQIYKPYKNGFQIPLIDNQGDKIVIATKQTNESEELKIALFENGKTLTETVIPFADKIASNIILGDNQFLIQISIKNEKESKLQCFDLGFEQIWEKDFEKRFYANKLTKDIENNSVLIMDLENVQSINLEKGITNWNYSINQNLKNPIYDIEVLSDIDSFTFTYGDYNEKESSTSNAILNVQSLKNAKVIYNEKLGYSISEIKVIPAEGGFLLKKNNKITLYEYFKE